MLHVCFCHCREDKNTPDKKTAAQKTPTTPKKVKSGVTNFCGCVWGKTVVSAVFEVLLVVLWQFSFKVPGFSPFAQLTGLCPVFGQFDRKLPVEATCAQKP